MNSKFIEKSINIKDIPSEYPMSSCLIENNEKQIGQVCDFLMNDKKLLLVNGFRGSGKSQVVKLATDSLTPETILLRYNCLETTILDDMRFDADIDTDAKLLEQPIITIGVNAYDE